MLFSRVDNAAAHATFPLAISLGTDNLAHDFSGAIGRDRFAW